MEMIDTHLHLIDRQRLSYPWLKDVPALNTDWPLATYQQEARRIGITAALHMEVDVTDADMEAETDWIAEQASTGSVPLIGTIAACRPEADDFPAYLERNAERVVGFRRPLHVVPDETSTSARFRENVGRIGASGKVFDICVLARQLRLAIELADAAPGTSMVLDHCGVPDIAGGAWDAWADNIQQISERPNVYVKISGIVAYGGDAWGLEDLRRWLDHVVTSFGPDRICWGGDWPVCTLGGGLATWVAVTRTLAEDWSAEDRAKLYHGNARRIWSL